MENYFSNVDIFPDKPKKNIDWAALIPQKAEADSKNPTENPESAEFDQINPINIFTKANLKLRKNTLIRNKTLKGKNNTRVHPLILFPISIVLFSNVGFNAGVGTGSDGNE